MHRKGIKLGRQSKYQMEVFDRKQVQLSLLYPFFPLLPLALWTMPVSATVVTDADLSARGTGVYMSTHGSSSAPHDSAQRSKLP